MATKSGRPKKVAKRPSDEEAQSLRRRLQELDAQFAESDKRYAEAIRKAEAVQRALRT